jgi:hypothetical protein
MVSLPNFHLVQASSSRNNIEHIDFSLRDVKARVVYVRPIVKRFLLVLRNIPIGGVLDNARKARLLGVGSRRVLSARLGSTQYESKRWSVAAKISRKMCSNAILTFIGVLHIRVGSVPSIT